MLKYSLLICLFLYSFESYAAADDDELSKKRASALHLAIEKRDVEMVRELLEQEDIDVNEEWNRMTPLRYAVSKHFNFAKKDYSAIIKVLLAHPKVDTSGILAYITSFSGQRFTQANIGGSLSYPLIEVFQAVLAHPHTEVNERDANGNTPLYLAVYSLSDYHGGGCPEIVDLLLSHPLVDVNALTLKGQTPLDAALINKSESAGDCLKKLLRHPQINVFLGDSPRGFLLLHVIYVLADLDIVKVVLDLGVSPDLSFYRKIWEKYWRDHPYCSRSNNDYWWFDSTFSDEFESKFCRILSSKYRDILRIGYQRPVFNIFKFRDIMRLLHSYEHIHNMEDIWMREETQTFYEEEGGESSEQAVNEGYNNQNYIEWLPSELLPQVSAFLLVSPFLYNLPSQ